MAAFDTTGIDLSGQVAIVTGGGRGLGREMARSLAAAGAAVAVVARSEDELAETVRLIKGKGGKAKAYTADVTNAAAIEHMVRAIETELGVVTTLINNAAVVGTPGPVWEMDAEMWRRTMEINVIGPFLCARAVLPGMVERRQGWIINVASGAALWAIPFGSAYCISKAALVRFTECLAADAGEHGVKAFVIDPGTVRTAMSTYLLESDEGKTYLPWFQRIFDEGRSVTSDLSAALVIVLASGKADALSGRFIGVSDDVPDMLANANTIEQDDLYTLRVGRLAR